MLSTINWSVFLMVLAAIVMGYYVIMIVLFYRQELKQKILSASRHHTITDIIGSQASSPEGSIDPAISVVSNDDVSLDQIPKLVADLQSILVVMKSGDKSTAENIELAKALCEKYDVFLNSPYQSMVVQYLHDALGPLLQVDKSEINSWWH